MKKDVKLFISIFLALVSINPLFSQWVQSNGPICDTVISIAIAGNNILASAGNRLYISTDGGKNWSPSLTGQPRTRSLVANGNIVVVKTFYDPFQDNPSHVGPFYRSINGGQSWMLGNDTALENTFLNFVFDGPNIYAMSAIRGLFVSTNSGESWVAVDTTIKGFGFAMNGSTLIVMRYDSIYVSFDKGSHWGIRNKMMYYGISIYPGIFTLKCQNIIAESAGAMMISSDYGSSWQQVVPFIDGITCFTQQGENIYAGSDNPGSAGGIFLSTDLGLSWTSIDSTANFLGNNYVYSFTVSDSNIYAGTLGNGIIHSSNNGTTWSRLNSILGIPNTKVTSLMANGTSIFSGTQYNGLFRSTNNGQTWTSVNTRRLNLSYIDASMERKGILYVGSDYLYYSTDNGNNWTVATSVGSVLFSDDTCIIAARDNSVMILSDNDTTWRDISYGLSSISRGTSTLLIGNRRIFLGGQDGAFRYDTLWVARHTAFIFKWKAINSGLLSLPVTALTLHGSMLFAGTNNGIFRSSDNGDNWIKADSGITSPGITCFTSKGKNIFAGTHGVGNRNPSLSTIGDGIFLSTDYGQNWIPINEGLTNKEILSIMIDGDDLIIGTDGSGVWRRPLSDVTAVGYPSPQFPRIFKLAQNYPNPFNPSTVINFQLPKKSFVSLKVFDVLGREVKTLINMWKDAGSHSVTFDANKYPSGVYFYRLQSGSFIETKKLILLR